MPRKNSMKIQSKGLFKGATVTANGDIPNKENPTAAGKIVNYSTQRNFRYCSAHVVWNQSSSNTVHYFGQDRKVFHSYTYSYSHTYFQLAIPSLKQLIQPRRKLSIVGTVQETPVGLEAYPRKI